MQQVMPATICPFCHDPMKPGQSVISCPVCNHAYHTPCWKQNGHKCAIHLCTGRGQIDDSPDPSPPTPPIRPPLPVPPRPSSPTMPLPQQSFAELLALIVGLPLSLIIPLNSRTTDGSVLLVVSFIAYIVGFVLTKGLKPRWLLMPLIVIGFQVAIFLAYHNAFRDLSLTLFYWNFWASVALAGVNITYRLIN